jgi:O-antigen/teichoic acid export membrane protein
MKTNTDIINSKFYILSNVINLLFYAFLYSVITIYIDPQVYGKFIYIYSFFLILGSLSSFGFLVNYRRNFFEYKKYQDLNDFLFTTLFYLFLISVIILILYFFINFFFFKIENIYLLLLSSIFLDNLIQCIFVHFENQKKAKKLFFYNLIKSFLYFLIAFTLLFFNQEEKSLIYSLFASKIIIFLIISIKNINFSSSKIKVKYFLDLFKISYPSTPRIMFGQLNASIDKIMISNFISFSASGIYSIGQSIAYSVYQITTSLDKVYVPKVYKYLFEKKNHKIGPYLTPFIYVYGWASIIVIFLSNFFVTFFLDQQYLFSKYIILIFSLNYFALSFYKISGHQLLFKKKIWLSTNIFFINILLNVILNIPLIYYFGMTGAAVASLIANLIAIITSIRYANKYAFFSYELKKLFIICSFVIVSFILAIALNIISLKEEVLFLSSFVLFFLLICIYIFYGFASKILTINSIKIIFTIKNMR